MFVNTIRITDLYCDDRAVSSVIAVVLMVAIAVIPAAVIGTFVLGVGGQVQNSAPQVVFSFETAGGGVKVIHESGHTFNSDNIFIEGATDDGTPTPENSWSDYNEAKEEVTPGNSVVVNDDGTGHTDGQEIRVVYKAPDSDKTYILEKYTYRAWTRFD